jgi:hypothetical protein
MMKSSFEEKRMETPKKRKPGAGARAPRPPKRP